MGLLIMVVVAMILVMIIECSITNKRLAELEFDIDMSREIEDDLIVHRDAQRSLIKIMWEREDELEDIVEKHDNVLICHENELALIEDIKCPFCEECQDGLDEYGFNDSCPICGGALDEVSFGSGEPFFECRQCEFTTEV